MTLYYAVRNIDTGLFWRGKGENKWGKYYNQAAIYRIKGQADRTVKRLRDRGIKAEIVPTRICEDRTVKIVEMGGETR